MSKDHFPWGTRVDSTPWDRSEVLVTLALAGFIYFQIQFLGAFLTLTGKISSPPRVVTYIIVSQCVLYGAGLILVFRLLGRLKLPWKVAFGWLTTPIHKSMLVVLLGVPAVMIPVFFTSEFTQFIFSKLGWSIEPQQIFTHFLEVNSLPLRIGLVLTAILGAPLVEEILFRGILYPCLKKQIGLLGAILLNATLFSLIHFHPPNFLPLFVLGIAFTIAYEWTGDLTSGILMHATFNASSLALFWYEQTHPTTAGTPSQALLFQWLLP